MARNKNIRYKYSDEYLLEMAAKSTSCLGMMRIIGYKVVSGAMQTHLKSRLVRANADLKHWLNSNAGRISPQRLTPETVFTRLPKDSLRRTPTTVLRRLLAVGVQHVCDECRLSSWQNKPLTLQIDHIDGDWRNNIRVNLRFLCPNCHTQTANWGKVSESSG